MILKNEVVIVSVGDAGVMGMGRDQNNITFFIAS
jgi:hypothetical protein